MGAEPFGKGAAEVDPEMFDEPMEDNSGLAFEMESERRSSTANRWWSSSS